MQKGERNNKEKELSEATKMDLNPFPGSCQLSLEELSKIAFPFFYAINQMFLGCIPKFVQYVLTPQWGE